MAGQSNTDELLRRLILQRFAELYEQMPYSVQFHILHCDSRDVADFTHRVSFSCCESCPHLAFKALVWCEHAQVEYEFGEPGNLPGVLEDMAGFAERDVHGETAADEMQRLRTRDQFATELMRGWSASA